MPSTFPELWPVEHPDRLQLYSGLTPNGVKATIALEELELEYEAHKVDLGGQQHHPSYLRINPNNKIPSLIDPNGPDGEPLAIMESGAILHYLAQKTGRLMPTDPARANEALQWLFFQAGSVGPMFGQYGHFVGSAPQDEDHSYAVHRYAEESKRILAVLEKRLDGRQWFLGEYSIVDIMIAPWTGMFAHYGGPVAESFSDYPRVVEHLERFTARPAVKRGMAVYA